ncbi:MauE/DoxX family redox-associated membrane protein [Mucilaginibacter aquaedulcis]|uniref:MauE/DoxX family redox-associated membrane protein n=1 Tax=Mucilaginibacter aquaedulcis TaxID=1187081 RepID=UPI0025B5C16C|nr:MauE/DoxX family redox-associated membrane protein [Mucilaginibacter aquaedulcis]MDN3548913.1 MauE/DoxX family redox-associated membrane protein [Mucilaginibacter aquaedulcis]
MKNIIKTAAPSLLILLFIYAASSKMMPPEAFRVQLYKQPFPHWLSDILVHAIPLTELLTAILLAFTRTRRTGLVLSALMLLIFSVYITLAILHYWAKVPCPCGGILTHTPWSAHLILNLGFAAIAVTALLLEPTPNHN